jgi:hypothetical protein
MSNRYFVCSISSRVQIDWHVSRIPRVFASRGMPLRPNNFSVFLYGVVEYVGNYAVDSGNVADGCYTGHGVPVDDRLESPNGLLPAKDCGATISWDTSSLLMLL